MRFFCVDLFPFQKMKLINRTNEKKNKTNRVRQRE